MKYQIANHFSNLSAIRIPALSGMENYLVVIGAKQYVVKISSKCYSIVEYKDKFSFGFYLEEDEANIQRILKISFEELLVELKLSDKMMSFGK